MFIFTIDQLYFHMFIFTTYQELLSHELISHIISRDLSLDYIFKFILLFHDLI
jgi:hypothetical protein